MSYTIRSVQENDAEAIINLLNPIIEAGVYTIMSDPLSVDDQLDYIRNFSERGVFNVAVCNDSNEIAGIQDVQPHSIKAFRHVGEISTFVSLTERQHGIGYALSQATFQEAKVKGFLKISAFIRADNPQALSFYQRQGFEVIGIAKKQAFVRGKYIDEVLTEKFLD